MPKAQYARLITGEVAKLLAKVKWQKYIRLACDSAVQVPHVLRACELLTMHGYRKEIFVYFLLNDFNDALTRLEALSSNRKISPFAQPYRDFSDKNQIIPQWQKDMARWINNKALFRSIPFASYEPRKGFRCSHYYTILK